MSGRSVAICIPTFNQARYLEQSVRSALMQSHPECEVWVADDASTDETSTVLEGLALQDPRLRYFRNAENLGISANNNWLLRQPTTDFIVRLDSDDILGVDYVAAGVNELERNPASGYVHCAIQEIDREGKPSRVRRLGRRGRLQGADEALRSSAGGYRVAANICLFRREVLHACDFYRKEMNFAEDWDLSVRIADEGWGNSYLEEVLASYRWWADEGGRNRRKMSEITGCTRVFQESLEPAFRKRNWDLRELKKSRVALAVNHAEAVRWPAFTAAEKKTLVELLHKLGGGPALERRLALLRSPLGFMVPLQRRTRIWCKDRLKNLVASRR